MKSAMILCALATVCCFSTGSAANNVGIAVLTNLKSRIQPTTDGLIRYRKDLDNTRSKLNDLKIAALSDINSIAKPALVAIQSASDQAKAAGKNADHCFEPARQRIKLASLNSAKMLDKCATDAVAIVDQVKEKIDVLLPVGNHITSELDAIAIECRSSNSTATQNCIAANAPEAKRHIDAYGNTASLWEQNGDRTITEAEISGQRCYYTAVQTVRKERNGADSDAHKCLANA